MLVGGGVRPAALMMRFVDLAGGPGRARIAVVPLASAEPAASGAVLERELDSLGADAFVVLLRGAEANTADAVRLLDSATGVWFGGGDQSRLTVALAGTASLDAIRARYRAGAVIGGTSAGAAIMSDSMLTGDQTPPGDTTGYYGDEYPAIARHRIEIVAGLGFLPMTIVDQHFIRRERHNRLLSAVLERPRMIGVGIDERTAVEVGPDGRWRILGESGVAIYDARRARVPMLGGSALGATDVRVHLLPPGGGYDPASGRASIPAQ